MRQRLPLVPAVAAYRFGTNLGGTQYVFDVRWNGRDAAWYVDLLDADESPIRVGIKVCRGTALGWSCRDPRMPDGLLVVTDLALSGDDATYNDLGERIVVDYTPFDVLSEERSG